MSPSEGISSLGEFLRHERERRGITLEQVTSATKINIRILQALESDHYTDLPAKPFIRGFVTSYCRFIGIDAKTTLRQFDAFIDQQIQNRPIPARDYSGYAFEKREGEQSRTVLWVVMGTFMVLGGIVLVVVKPSLKHHHGSQIERLHAMHASASPGPEAVGLAMASPEPSESPAPSVSPIAATPTPSLTPSITPKPKPSPSPTPTARKLAPTPTPTPHPVHPTPAPSMMPGAPPLVMAPTPSASATPETNGKPDPLNSGVDIPVKEIHYKIIYKSLADVWIRYQCDTKPVMKFMFRKGKVLVLRGRKMVRFQASNAQSVTLSANGGKTEVMAEDPTLSVKQGTPTLLIPPQLAKTITEPFPGEKALPPTKSP